MWVATSPLRCYKWPKGKSNVSGDEWHVTIAVTSGCNAVILPKFFQNFAKCKKMKISIFFEIFNAQKILRLAWDVTSDRRELVTSQGTSGRLPLL